MKEEVIKAMAQEIEIGQKESMNPRIVACNLLGRLKWPCEKCKGTGEASTNEEIPEMCVVCKGSGESELPILGIIKQNQEVPVYPLALCKETPEALLVGFNQGVKSCLSAGYVQIERE